MSLRYILSSYYTKLFICFTKLKTRTIGCICIVLAFVIDLKFLLCYSHARHQGTARLLFNSFASSLWMMPFSKYCQTDKVYWKHFSMGSSRGHHVYQCDEQEYRSNYSGWPTNIINIEIPSNRGTSWKSRFNCMVKMHRLLYFFCSLAGVDAYPSVTDIADVNLSNMECGLPTQLSFSAREISDGTFFKAIEDYDPDSKRLLHQLQK